MKSVSSSTSQTPVNLGERRGWTVDDRSVHLDRDPHHTTAVRSVGALEATAVGETVDDEIWEITPEQIPYPWVLPIVTEMSRRHLTV